MQCVIDSPAMARNKLVRTGAFTAVAEDGREFRVYVFQPSVHYATEWFQGETELLTRDGEAVEYTSKGNYEVLQVYEHVKVKTVDPRAP